MKKCTTCKKEKPISEFYKNKNTSGGFFNSCKTCLSKEKKKKKRTKRGVLAKIYDGQRCTSKRRGDPQPSYTLNWLVDWCFAQPLYHRIYDNWVEKKYNKWLKPSIDRIDDNKPYTEDNIQIMTWKENSKKAHSDRMNGRNVKACKKTYQCFLTGDVYMEHHSVRSASRITGIESSNICAAINGRQKTAGGYIWRH